MLDLLPFPRSVHPLERELPKHGEVGPLVMLLESPPLATIWPLHALTRIAVPAEIKEHPQRTAAHLQGSAKQRLLDLMGGQPRMDCAVDKLGDLSGLVAKRFAIEFWAELGDAFH
jgi:hypothetical protein